MWGKKNTDEDNEAVYQEEQSSSRMSHDREPNERTRLLERPRPPNADGYLDPDDPAVSIA